MSDITTETTSKGPQRAKEKRAPSYPRHRQSGQAIVTLTDGLGNRRDVLLGKYGTAASRQEYARVISEWEAAYKWRCWADTHGARRLGVTSRASGECGRTSNRLGGQVQSELLPAARPKRPQLGR